VCDAPGFLESTEGTVGGQRGWERGSNGEDDDPGSLDTGGGLESEDAGKGIMGNGCDV
jgi:hypothetical protein